MPGVLKSTFKLIVERFVKGESERGKDNPFILTIGGSGTSSETVIEHLCKIPLELRREVEEITLDMAGSMNLIAKKCFPKAVIVTDRFHVQQLALSAVQDLRVKHRWKALDKENEEIEKAKEHKKTYHPIILENGDTNKQLLARSRYSLFKKESDWTPKQKQRITLLFELYPDVHQAYELSERLKWIYEQADTKVYARTRLALWHEQVAQSGFKSFNTISRTITNHYETTLNYFDNRSTNASAESFNAKIKAFRSQFRGVTNIGFFLLNYPLHSLNVNTLRCPIISLIKMRDYVQRNQYL